MVSKSSLLSDDVDEWREEYKGCVLTPIWDPQRSSVAYAFSNENRKITRKGGEGFFPKAITINPLTVRRYRLEFMYVSLIQFFLIYSFSLLILNL